MEIYRNCCERTGASGDARQDTDQERKRRADTSGPAREIFKPAAPAYISDNPDRRLPVPEADGYRVEKNVCMLKWQEGPVF
jgi:hypothetical protein